MTALSAERIDGREQTGTKHTYDVAANAVIWKGAQVALNSGGYLVPVTETTGLATVGIAIESKDNTGGANGALRCMTRRGVFKMDNSAASDEITAAEIGSACYGVDDRTVAKTDDGGARSVAGVVHDLTADGLFVRYE